MEVSSILNQDRFGSLATCAGTVNLSAAIGDRGSMADEESKMARTVLKSRRGGWESNRAFRPRKS